MPSKSLDASTPFSLNNQFVHTEVNDALATHLSLATLTKFWQPTRNELLGTWIVLAVDLGEAFLDLLVYKWFCFG